MKPEIAAGADAAAAVLVLVDERHPEAIVLLPLDLVLGRPAIPVGAVSAALRREVVPHRLPGVLLVPVGLPRAHQVAIGVVDREGRHEREVEREEFLQHLVPFGRAGLGALLEHLSGDREAEIFVVVVVVEREVLDHAILEQGFGQSVVMLGAREPPARRGERVHAGDGHLGVMAARAEAELGAFVERRFHDGGRRAEEFYAVGAAFLELAQPGPPLVRAYGAPSACR